MSSTELALAGELPAKLSPIKSIFASEPNRRLEFASEVATVLSDVIKKQKLSSNVQGKPHVRVEGWTTLGAFLGVLPCEKSVRELEDGSYEAFVELVRESDGRVVGAASALCGAEEVRWSKAERYARRSMAVTRAVGKAYRLSFGWIMTLAGYQVTPFEEMPDKEVYTGSPHQKQEVWDALKATGLTNQAHKFVQLFMGRPMSGLESDLEFFRRVSDESVGGNSVAKSETSHADLGKTGL